jgi:hypothetical protein
VAARPGPVDEIDGPGVDSRVTSTDEDSSSCDKEDDEDDVDEDTSATAAVDAEEEESCSFGEIEADEHTESDAVEE